MNQDAIIEALFAELEKSVTDFEKVAKATQIDLFKEVSLMLKELAVDENGNIKPTVANIKLTNSITNKLERIIQTPEYLKALKIYSNQFEVCRLLQSNYFGLLLRNYKEPLNAQSLQDISRKNAVDALTDAGLKANISDKLSKLLSDNVRTGLSWQDMNAQVKTFILGNKEVNGKLVSYSGQITTDLLNQYSRNYDQLVVDKYELKWYKYNGALVKDSRPFCMALVSQKYVHESQLPSICQGNVNGQKVSLQGLIAGTNKDNILTNAGGYRCNHRFIPISEENVPKQILTKFENANRK